MSLLIRPTSDANAQRPIARWGTFLALAGIVAAGLVLRLYRLGAQSVWLDEYFAAASFMSPDTQTFLRLFSLFSPDAMPLGFLPLYWWGSLVGQSSFIALRLQPVALSVLCIPLLWLIGREVHSNRAGLFAATLLAISPVHIWIGQSIRPNIFIEVYALISVYALLNGIAGRRRGWWLVHLAANLLLIWTHIFTVFLVAAEGLCLLFLLRNRTRVLAGWCIATAVSGLSAILWFGYALSSVPHKDDDFIMTVPPFSRLLADWIADDAGHLSDPFLFQQQVAPSLPEPLGHIVAGAHAYFDVVLIVFFAAVIVWGAWAAAKRFGAHPPGGGEANAGSCAGMVLMLGIGLMPLALMLAASVMWRPCVLPRYTSYSSMMLYVVAGAALSRITFPQWRYSIAALLALTYAYQLSFVLFGQTRTDWIGVDCYVGARARPQDVVLLKGTFMARETHAFNARETKIPVLPVYTLQAMSEKAEHYLNTTKEGESATVWAVIEPFIYTLPPLEDFEQSLLAKGMKFQRRDFPGMNGLLTYAITKAPGTAKGESPLEIRGPTDCLSLLAALGVGNFASEQRDTAAHLLRRVVDTEWPLTRFYFSLLAFNLCDEGCPEFAVAAARKAVALDSTFSMAHMALAVALGESGDAIGAIASMNEAARVDRFGYFAFYLPLFEALYQKVDMVAAKREFDRLHALGVFLPQVLRARMGQVPETLTSRLRIYADNCP